MVSLADVAPTVNASLGVVSGIQYRNPDRMMIFARGRPLTLARYPNTDATDTNSLFLGLATMSAGYAAPQSNGSVPPKVPNAISYAGADGAQVKRMFTRAYSQNHVCDSHVPIRFSIFSQRLR